MFKRFFLNPAPITLDRGIATARIIVGALLAYHGIEVFNSSIMAEYMTWDVFAGSNAGLLAYTGKSFELIAGLLLLFGLLTRLGALMMIGTLSYITFFVGSGRFWYQDQHPFLFVLFGLLFIFTGPGAWSLDGLLFGERKEGEM